MSANEIGLLLFPDKWLPYYIKDKKGIYEYRRILKQLLLNKYTIYYLLHLGLRNTDDKTQYRILTFLKVIRAILKNNPFGDTTDCQTNNQLFELFKVYVFHKNKEIASNVNVLLIGKSLEDKNVRWLILKWSHSEHIVNRLLRYPEKNPMIAKWARRMLVGGQLKERESELIARLIDENARPFPNKDHDALIWAIYYSHISDVEKQELLIESFSFESLDAIWEVALRLRLREVVEYMRMRVSEKAK